MVDTSKTRSQLKQRAAKDLGIIEPGEALSTEDDDTLDGLLDPLVAQLSADEIIDIQDTEAIELAYFLPLARLLANIAGPDFGSPINEQAKAVDEALLRKMTATKPTLQTIKTKYF